MMADKLIIDSEGVPWYLKVFMCLIHRNRISPEKIELPDCDFFIVEPRRTLRILRPIQKSDEFYEIPNDRPESINENFISKWTKRPHSLNKCRCSFRQSSSSRISPEREMISAEINRIRTSLCEAEKTGQDIDELEKRISVNLNCFNEPIGTDMSRKRAEKSTDASNTNTITTGHNENSDLNTKNKIVKDLEKYIDVLLKEILNDTMKFISDADDTLVKSRKTLNELTRKNLHDTDDESLKSPFNISFAFLPDHQTTNDDMVSQQGVINASNDNGYVNHAFIGSANDPDCLDFDLRKPIDDDKNLDKLDCVDSSINSVETMEFPLEPELSLEQSLMEIIDAKFGRVPLPYSWESLDTPHNIVQKDGENPGENLVTNDQEKKYDDIDSITTFHKDDSVCEGNLSNDLIDPKVLDSVDLDMPMTENKFDGLKLELKDDSEASTMNDESVKKINSVAVFCEKLSLKLSRKGNTGKKNQDDRNENVETDLEFREKRKLEGVEMKDYRAIWKGCKESNPSPCDNELKFPKDSVVFRRNRKPVIVFLHGFGSSAEVFEHQLQYFSAMGYPCIAPELLGHGMSSAPDRLRDYHFDKLLNDIEIVLHHYAFKPGRKCVLVAHNYGCSFATALACKYENEIRQLVLISGGGPTPLAPPTTEGVGECCLRLVLSPLLVCGLRRDLLYSARGRQHPYCGSELDNQRPSHMKHILNGMIWPEGDYIFHRRISTPTLLIHGLRDNKVSLVQECQMERTILKAFLEAIPTAGHIPMTDTPEQVNHMIHCFIDLSKKKKW